MSNRRAMISPIVILLIIHSASSFNLSPKPNLIIKEPTLSTIQVKTRSSYFGYTLLLKSRSIFVGAPRAQSNLESQRNINETGLLYKCALETGSPEHCVPYVVDKLGDNNDEDMEHTIESKKKEFQWLGGALDGGPKETDPLIVCAPRMKSYTSFDYYLHGICYRTPDTTEEMPTKVKALSPLKSIAQQNIGDSLHYACGESGFSVHWTGSETDELLIGAPGISDWKGSVIRYRLESDKDLGGLQKRDLTTQTSKRFANSIPNPKLWNQPDNSYFGYAESSGYFNVDGKRTLLYVSSAPRANNYDGEVYIFDMVKEGGTYNIKKYQTFGGKEFGEYFGYSVLATDLNGDGYTDIIVSAPYYSLSNAFNSGAVYVYINIGKNFVFKEQIVVNPRKDSGNYGTTMSLLGDINHDGFNDIAIAAPFSSTNGLVHIYLGSSDGLKEKPSQTIKAPSAVFVTSRHMFGHGLSKGLDIDANGYNDLAVGAPNAETVYIFKAYPIVKIVSTFESLSREIQLDQTSLRLKVCFEIVKNATHNELDLRQSIRMKMEADTKLKRVKFANQQTSMESIIALSTGSEWCQTYDTSLNVDTRYIYEHIECKLSYDLINRVPNSEEFCNTCAALDPDQPNVKLLTIVQVKNCSSEICVSDLVLSSVGVSEFFTLGSSKTLSIKYNIRNDGETAYLPQLNISTSNNMAFAKVPSMCVGDNYLMICNVNQGQPFANGKSDTITIQFDASKIDVPFIDVRASVFSTGKERNPDDNAVIDRITIRKMSTVEVIRTNKYEIVAVDEQSGHHEFVNRYEIKNSGPSYIEAATISIEVPLRYLLPKTTKRVAIIAPENVTVSANFASFELHKTYYEDWEKYVSDKPYGGRKKTEKLIAPLDDSLHATNYNSFDSGLEFEHTNDDFVNNNSFDVQARRRRSIEGRDGQKMLQKRATAAKKSTTFYHELTGTVDASKVIAFNCQDRLESECMQILMTVHNFGVSNERGVNIELKFIADLDTIRSVFVDDKNFFFISNDFNITRTGDDSGQSIHVPQSTHYIVVTKHRISSTPWWVILISVLAGLLLLAAAAYGLYKFGFFNRTRPDAAQTANLTNADADAVEPMIEMSARGNQ